ncbi:MAG: 4-alpha-glucanotransferase [Treponema sp.]
MIDPRYDYKELHTKRASGFLLPIFALPDSYGIGCLGKKAYEFVDFLCAAGQRYWQILPLGPTGYGNSPYASTSSFAGNPYFIDLEALHEQGLLTAEELKAAKPPAKTETASLSDPQGTPSDTPVEPKIDYGFLYHTRSAVLKKACKRFLQSSGNRGILDTFLQEQGDWLEDFALFSALRHKYGDSSWVHWPLEVKKLQPETRAALKAALHDEIIFTVFVQYMFETQWQKLKHYAAAAGVHIIGDIPIYAAHDSADVWANQAVFCMEADGSLAYSAGCPPGDFDNPDDQGQLWGMPVYDWAYLERTHFDWFIKRFRRQAAFYDVLRLDHFRGYESFWRIPAGKDARSGAWIPAGGSALFTKLAQELPHLQIIAEDLGFITKEVSALRKAFGYPSMRILQNGLYPGWNNEHTPHHYDADTVLYFGIHDNEPLALWYSRRSEEEKQYAASYLCFSPHESTADNMMKAMAASIADTVIFQVQDILFLGEHSRINVPGCADGNWEFILTATEFNALKDMSRKIRNITALYGRKR